MLHRETCGRCKGQHHCGARGICCVPFPAAIASTVAFVHWGLWILAIDSSQSQSPPCGTPPAYMSREFAAQAHLILGTVSPRWRRSFRWRFAAKFGCAPHTVAEVTIQQNKIVASQNSWTVCDCVQAAVTFTVPWNFRIPH